MRDNLKVFLYFALFSVWGFIGNVAHAEHLRGKIVSIHDGDTVTLLDDKKHQKKIRLAEIDAPELKQPHGYKSKQMLSDLVFGKDVKVIGGVIDKYGRTVGRIYQGNTDVNLTMVRQGGAWAYRKYLTDDAIIAAEESAKTARAGLWSLQDDQRITPWQWRHGKKQTEERAAQDVPPAPLKEEAIFTCAGKTLCKQMVGCAEAKFYLTQCGIPQLDGDHDGVPCESICR